MNAEQHTPGPWKVMPCPQHHGKHPFHDHRWIATADAVVEFGHDPRSWGVENGSLICEMRDGPPANAHLIAAAPDMAQACRLLMRAEDMQQGARGGATMGAISTAIDAARLALRKVDVIAPDESRKPVDLALCDPRFRALVVHCLQTLNASDAEHPDFLDSCADSIDLFWGAEHTIKALAREMGIEVKPATPKP